MTAETSDIQITKIGEEPGAASLQVEVAAERVKVAEQKATKAFAKQAKMPGFRRGKVPEGVIRRQFKDAIKDSVLRELISESWKAAIDQEGLEPIAEPRVTELSFEQDAPLKFQLEVEIKPEITLDRVGSFELTRHVAVVTDDMVEDHVEQVRKQKAPWTPIDEKPAPGQMVSVSIATVGETSEESKPYQIVLGEGQAIPDLEEAIMALTPGKTSTASVKYPDDFPDESKRGQPRSVRIELHEVKRLDLPALDDAFAREVGDFDSVDDLRKAVRDDMENEATREADADIRRQVMEQVVAANNLVPPKPLVHRLLSGYAQAYQVSDEQLESFSAEFLPIAERQVQRDLVIDHLAQREKLVSTEEDLDRRIEEIAERRGSKPGEVYASLQKAGRIKEIEQSLTEENVFAYLLEQSTIAES
jgi:trigger factor